jgi:hypothetical protein
MESFVELYRRLLKIDFFGTGGVALPAKGSLAKAVSDGALLLPNAYVAGYAQPLEQHLSSLLQQVAKGRLDPETLETLAGAMYQHRSDTVLAAPLQRFLAVISNLYRSFLDANKRSNAGVPLVEMLPPVAMFQHDGKGGPFTITVEEVERLIGALAGVVSMPATYAGEPLIWAALAHETGGHDVTHADTDLLPELTDNVQAAFAGIPAPPGMSRDDLTLLWGYWMDEASADVYGLLNIGPAFAPNLAVFFAALNAQATGAEGDPPKLRMESGFDSSDPSRTLDPHPTDVLRLHLALGAIDALSHLTHDIREKYTQIIEGLARSLGTGDVLTIDGNIPIERDHLRRIQAKVPLAPMQLAARQIGGYIASAKLNALNGHSIQDIETWDDNDESRAQAVREAALSGKDIGSLGDDAQLLAGATLALLQEPDRYDAVTAALNSGLDLSFRRDPIWGSALHDFVYVRYAVIEPSRRTRARSP